MEIPRFVLIIVCFLFFLSSLQAQSVNSSFDRLTIKDGLSQSTINDIMQDKNGFMWFATYGGLNKYDGYHFTHYQHDENDSTTIGNNEIMRVFEDKEGFIWCVSATAKGLDRFNPLTEEFIHFKNNPNDPKSISSNLIYQVSQDKKGNLWIITDKALDLVIKKTEKEPTLTFRHFPIPAGSKPFTRMFEDSKGNMLMFSDSLMYFDRTTETFRKTDIVVTSYSVITVAEDKAGSIYIATYSNGAKKLDWNPGISGYVLSSDNSINVAPETRTYILNDNKEQIWIGTETHGLFQYNPHSGQTQNYITDNLDPRTISDNNIHSLYIDRSGVLWIGTNNQGLCKYDLYRKEFVHFKSVPGKVNSLAGNVIGGIHSNHPKELWVANRDNGGVNRFVFDENNTPQVIHYLNNPKDENTIASNNPICLLQRKNGDVWVSNQGTISVITPERGRIKRYPIGSWTFEFYEDHNGVLWGGTWGSGLWRFDDVLETFTFYQNDPEKQTSLCDNVIWAICEDNHGNLWIGGHDKGLSILPSDQRDLPNPSFVSYSHKKGDLRSLSNNTINVICQDKEGTIWLGTNEGLSRIKYQKEIFQHIADHPLQFYTLYKRNGLPNDAVIGIIEVNDGCLWMSTSMGISKFQKTDSTFTNFDENDGLQSNEFSHGAYFLNSEGRLFFGGPNGFNAFYPDQIKPNPIYPQIVFTDFKIFNKSVGIGEKINKQTILTKPLYLTREIILSHKNNAFTIEFAALHFTQPVKNQYAYYLEGFEEKMNYSGNQRSATYTNLSPGKYTFKVKGTNNDGLWSETIATLIIRVRPPWWRTWWFRILVIGLIAFLIYTYIMNRIQAEQHDKAVLEAKLKEGALELEKRQAEINNQKKEILEKETAAMETNWFNKGMTMAMDIIGKNSRDLNALASNLISVLVEYIGVDIGAIYILAKEGDSAFFDLVGSYALNLDAKNKRISAEEGYIGVCFKEKTILVVDNLPHGYVVLQSGLGKASLQYLILIPLILENEIKGVIELASKAKPEGYKFTLLERLAENLASSIEIVQMNNRMQSMVDQLNNHMEEMNAQKEEMLQNMEEMTTTQEESYSLKEKYNLLERKIAEHEALIQQKNEELMSLKNTNVQLLKKFKKITGKAL